METDQTGIIFLLMVVVGMFVLLGRAADKHKNRRSAQEIWQRLKPRLPVEAPSRPDPRTRVQGGTRSLVADNEYMLLAGAVPDPRIGWSRGDVVH